MRLRARRARGRTVDDAVGEALRELGLAPEQVAVEVLDPGRRGLFGLGAREASVVVTPELPATEIARGIVGDLVAAGGFAVQVQVKAEEDGSVGVELVGDGLGTLIGRRGRTLEALQYLINVACARAPGGPRRVFLDIGGYRARRLAAVRRQAVRAVENVRRSGRSVALEPMLASERRAVHLAVQELPGVVTRSEGEEPYRRVVIAPEVDAPGR